jgi:hypothetical protein
MFILDMREKNLKSEILNRVWKIRDNIQELENVKDKIIEFLRNEGDLDENAESIWISDAKEFYYNVVGAWELLRATAEGKEKYLDNSKGYLYAAKSRLAQSISELKTFNDKKADEIILKAEKAFSECWELFNFEYDILTPKKEIKEPIQQVIKVSDLEYHLPCSVCGDIAVEFAIGKGRFDKEEKLVFRGITHGTSLRRELADKLFEILETKNLLGAHDFMKKYHGFEGLDAYCPICDKIYCWEHYKAEEVFDDGFYDCTYGTCPVGHKRMIDD